MSTEKQQKVFQLLVLHGISLIISILAHDPKPEKIEEWVNKVDRFADELVA